jgi:hypothetical protein
MGNGRTVRRLAVVWLAALAAWTGSPAAASADSRPAIPDRIVAPDPQLPTMEQGGPVGPVAVLFGAERTSDDGVRRNGLVAVSATSGEYRFVELPRRAYAEDGASIRFFALSPDGRRIAYRLAAPDDPDRVVGLASYDTVTGDLTTRRVPTRHGLSAQILEWTSERELLVRYAHLRRRPEGGLEPGTLRHLTWDGVGSLRPMPAPRRLSVDWAREGVLNTEVNPSGTRAAGHFASPGPLPVWVADSLEPPVRARRLRIGLPVWLILRWEDERHLLLRAGRRPDAVGVYRVDVVTGAKQLLVREDIPFRSQPPPRYASGLWDRPTVERPLPPRTPTPAAGPLGGPAGVVALTGGVVAALVGAGWLLRRGARRSEA